MHELYRATRKMNQKERLELAEKFLASPGELDRKYRDSVNAYGKGYTNAKQEAFHPTERRLEELPAADRIRSGRDLGRILANPPGRRWKVEGASNDLSFRFVDYEVPPLRTTGGATWTEPDLRSRGPVADLLLAAADGTPVVGEVKAVTETHFDTDHVMALVQGLLLTAAFASPQQRRRLSGCYQEAGLDLAGQLGLYVIVVDPENPPARPRYQAKLTTAATELIDELRKQPSIKATLKQIEFVYARWNGTRLRLSVKKH